MNIPAQVQVVQIVPDIQDVQAIQTPTSFLPRIAGEDEGGGLNHQREART
jgi:hypothetical protein